MAFYEGHGSENYHVLFNRKYMKSTILCVDVQDNKVQIKNLLIFKIRTFTIVIQHVAGTVESGLASDISNGILLLRQLSYKYPSFFNKINIIAIWV